jgi:hypothetical protein
MYGRGDGEAEGANNRGSTEAIRMALSGIASDLELGEIAARLAPLHPKNNTFPARSCSSWPPTQSRRAVRPGGTRSSSRASASVTFPKTGPTRGPSTTVRSRPRRWTSPKKQQKLKSSVVILSSRRPSVADPQITPGYTPRRTVPRGQDPTDRRKPRAGRGMPRSRRRLR